MTTKPDGDEASPYVEAIFHILGLLLRDAARAVVLNPGPEAVSVLAEQEDAVLLAAEIPRYEYDSVIEALYSFEVGRTASNADIVIAPQASPDMIRRMRAEFSSVDAGMRPNFPGAFDPDLCITDRFLLTISEGEHGPIARIRLMLRLSRDGTHSV